MVQRAPSTIAGEPLHDLDRAVGLLKSSKFYAEGARGVVRFADECVGLTI